MDAQLKSRIEGLISSSPVFIFMKGSKLMPQCGFSNNVVQIFNSLGVPFEEPMRFLRVLLFVRSDLRVFGLFPRARSPNLHAIDEVLLLPVRATKSPRLSPRQKIALIRLRLGPLGAADFRTF